MAQDNLPIAKGTTYDIRSLHSFQFKKSVISELYKIYGEGFNTLDIFRSLGRSGGKLIPNETLTAEEEGYDVRTITLAATVTVSDASTISFVLDADDVDGSGNYYPRIGFTITFGDTTTGFTECQITSVTSSGGDITVAASRYNTSATSLLTLESAGLIAVGTEVAITSGAFAAETGQPTATSVGTFEREFTSQILKETITFGGMELAKQKWIPMNSGTALFNKELSRAEFALDRQIEAAIIMGQVNNNSLVQASSVTGNDIPVHKIKGMYSWLEELGYELNYSGATSIAFSDLDTMSEYFESQGVTESVILVVGGGNFLRRVENSGVTYVKGTSGGLATDNFFYGANDMIMSGEPDTYLNVGFRGIRKGGNLFLFKTLNMFTNPFQYGIDGYMLNDAALAFPLSMVKDKKIGAMVPNAFIHYVGMDGYSRERVAGGLAGMDGYMQQKLNLPLVSAIDANNFYWLTNPIFRFHEANKGIIIKRSS